MTFDSSHVPQANRPELVLRISEMAATGPLNLSDIREVLQAAGRGEFVERQALYYARAAELFGLIEASGSQYSATALANQIRESSNRQETKQLLKASLFSNPLMVKIGEVFANTRPTKDQIADFLQANTSLAASTCQRRASSVLTFLNHWLYGELRGKNSLNSREWAVIKTLDDSLLPEWAQFFLDLGRLSALESEPGRKTWRLVTVPNRNMVSALFSLGYLEASIPKVLATIEEFDIADLEEGDQITWKINDLELVFGFFKKVNEPHPERGTTFSHSRQRAGGGLDSRQRDITRAREFQFAQFYGDPFVNPRQMSRNRPFFESFVGQQFEDLLCNSISVVCMAGRPALRDDLTSPEFKISKSSGALDDLLRVWGVNDVNEVAHYLTDYASPDWDTFDIETPMCAVFDGHLSYPRLKHYIEAEDNLVVLDRWDKGSVDSFNSFDVERASRGQIPRYKPDGLKIPAGVEYIEWSETK